MTETCPERPNDPNGHAIECVEQPEDMDAFYVQRCMLCGKVEVRHDTEQEHLDEFGPEDGKTEPSTDMGGLF